jgi:hypothetical protein
LGKINFTAFYSGLFSLFFFEINRFLYRTIDLTQKIRSSAGLLSAPRHKPKVIITSGFE